MKKNVITMPKAILELEMPESCKQCKLGHYDELYDITHCDILRECMPYEGRHPDCPIEKITDKIQYRGLSRSEIEKIVRQTAEEIRRKDDELLANSVAGTE